MSEAVAACRSVATRGSPFAFLMGPTAVGKTHLAIAAFNKISDDFAACVPFFARVGTLLGRMREAYSSNIEPMQAVRRFYSMTCGLHHAPEDLQTMLDDAPDEVDAANREKLRRIIQRAHTPCVDQRLLVLDDLGASYDTPWARDVVLELIDWRVDEGFPTIVTSNAKREDLDPRLATRLQHGLVYCEGTEIARPT